MKIKMRKQKFKFRILNKRKYLKKLIKKLNSLNPMKNKKT